MENNEMTLSQKFKLATVLVGLFVFIMFVFSFGKNRGGTIENRNELSLCENILIQETNNIKIGIQDKEGLNYLLNNSNCNYSEDYINSILGFNDGLYCDIELWREYGWQCIDHINDRYPGKLTEDGLSQQIPELVGETSHDRFKQLAEKYGLNASIFWEIENKYNIREGVLLAIVIAETSGGKRGNYVNEGCYNYGNVANNDRGDRFCYNTPKESIEAIGRALNNKYLGNIQTLGCLSNAGSCQARDDNGHRYATSNGNWERTIVNVLNAIYSQDLGEIEPNRFNVRRSFIQYQ